MAQRGSNRRSWVKLWITGWLHGSIRWQLNAAERATWADLICLAGECNHNGKICDNDGGEYPISYIANQLNIPLDLLGSTITKCKAEGRIEDRQDGVIVIANWAAYQSEYARQKKYRDKKRDGDKKSYGQFENVMLTDVEKTKLVEKFGEQGFTEKIDIMSCAIESHGYNYKSHYAALLNWDRKDKEKDGTHKSGAGKVPSKYTRPEELLQ